MANPRFGQAFTEILEFLGKVGAVGGTLGVVDKLNEWKQYLQDLNPKEKSELEDIIQTYNLKVSLSGCTQEHQALVEIINALKDVDPGVRDKVRSAIDRVLSQD